MKTFDLFKPEDNIRLGIGYMRDIREYYTPDFLGVAVAYNAGPGRYTQWKRKLSSDPDLYVEQIPFQETYQYVKVLLTDRSRYRALLRQKP
jgi:soluble lytic murein transglycosylase